MHGGQATGPPRVAAAAGGGGDRRGPLQRAGADPGEDGRVRVRGAEAVVVEAFFDPTRCGVSGSHDAWRALPTTWGRPARRHRRPPLPAPVSQSVNHQSHSLSIRCTHAHGFLSFLLTP